MRVSLLIFCIGLTMTKGEECTSVEDPIKRDEGQGPFNISRVQRLDNGRNVNWLLLIYRLILLKQVCMKVTAMLFSMRSGQAENLMLSTSGRVHLVVYGRREQVLS